MSAADETWRMLAGIIEATRIIPEGVRAAPGSLPLTVIGGFLGAGKTTLLNRLLTGSHGKRLAVLVNDFGRINIDAALIRARTADTISLTNGCACCIVSGDLTRALLDLSQREEPPEGIVLEASGIADPRSLAQVALANRALRLDGLVTVVDAETIFELAGDAGFGALFRAQVEAADIIALTKQDLVPAKHVAQARAWLHEHAPGRPILDAVQGDVPAHVLLGIETGRSLEHATADRNHVHRFRSRSFEHAEPLDGAALQCLLEGIGEELVRAKGILWLANAPQRRTVYQRVGKRETFTPGDAWGDEVPVSRLVVIGRAP